MSAQSDVERYRRAVTDLQKKIGQASSKIAAARTTSARARAAAQQSRSATTQTSKMREADREESKAISSESARAKLESQLASQQKKLYEAEAKVGKERDAAQARGLKDIQASVRRSEAQFRPRWESPLPLTSGLVVSATPERPQVQYDLFISHASEDKDEIATPLAAALIEGGVRVWFDAFALSVGDSLRRKIDHGLANSMFGVVILSPEFFAKEWPQKELDGLTAKATASGQSTILPIWHRLTKDELMRFSPTLADLVALNSAVMTVEEIAESLIAKVHSSNA